jgi:hypothetical protein
MDGDGTSAHASDREEAVPALDDTRENDRRASRRIDRDETSLVINRESPPSAGTS